MSLKTIQVDITPAYYSFFKAVTIFYLIISVLLDTDYFQYFTSKSI